MMIIIIMMIIIVSSHGFSWLSNRIILWYQMTSRHLRYPSPFL